ncbi:MAG: hypothetical protein HC895_23455, partial [Leptolyngbyaceae cyanobacterium SM1_3_5]|nr:hypothetical protein [Leptolyngbyaceae cyanobacterium SM1_3_5]
LPLRPLLRHPFACSTAPTTPPATAEPTPAQPGDSPPASSGESEPSGESESSGESEPSGEAEPSDQLGQDGSSESESGESQGGILEGLPPVPQLQAPPSFTARVGISAPPSDVPQPLAEPIETARSFVNDASGSACGVISPDLAYFLGTSVEFLVRVDRDPSDPALGRVAADGITPLQRSGSDEYDAIATCLLLEWTFRPPDTDAAAENEAPSSQVIVTMQLAPDP